MRHLKYFLVLLVFVACKNAPTKQALTEPYRIQKKVIGEKAVVVSAHPLATKAGVDVLERGGNAVDAAIAVNFALAVVYQRAGNIGGGGFMVVRTKDGEKNTLDFREKAPLAAHKDMYLDSSGNVVDGLSVRGHLSAGVPGAVAGMAAAHEKYGKLDFAELVKPAHKIAVEGFKLTTKEAEVLNKFQADIQELNTSPNAFMKDTPWEMGDLIVQKDLGETLQRIIDNGKAGFYEGITADKIVAEMKAGGGLITHEDLKKYQAVWRAPVTFEYDNYSLISMPPPSSGGIALAQMLGMVEPFPLHEYGFQSTEAVHLMVEAERRAYADRAEHLGDPDFYKVPYAKLVAEDYLASRMENFDKSKVIRSDSMEAGSFETKESEQTTHFSIVDAEGNAVSLTTTLNSNFGSKVVVSGAGFFLNNEMDDFSAKPGVPNQFGLVGAEANAVAPEKRMLSSMTPTIIEKDDQLFMVVGTPGGSTIITSVYQVILNVIEFGLSLEDAVHNKRFHHQWLPDKVFIEKGALSEKVIKDLEKQGHIIEERSPIGKVEAILVEKDGTLTGVADNRGDDHAQAAF